MVGHGKSGVIGGRFVTCRMEGFMGIQGNGIFIATFRIPSCTLASYPSNFASRLRSSFLPFSRSSTLLWWLAAHFSTLPWNTAKWWFRARLASPRNVTASCIRATWVAWCSRCTSASVVRSMMVSHTCRAKVWYTLATTISSLLTHASAISSFASSHL